MNSNVKCAVKRVIRKTMMVLIKVLGAFFSRIPGQEWLEAMPSLYLS